MEKINVECSFCGIVGSYKTILNHINCDHPDPETNNCESQAGCSNVQESQENSEVDETDNSKNLAEWTEGETKLLLDKYGQYMVMIGPMKQFKTKKTMWKKIAIDLKNILGVSKTSLQCENRYKTIMKRKKKAIDNNKSTGRSKMTVPYENELSGIVGFDDSIKLEVLMDAKHLVVNKKRTLSNLGNKTKENVSDKGTNAKKKKISNKNRSVEDTLKEIHENREERRHRNKLELFKQFCEKYYEKKSE